MSSNIGSAIGGSFINWFSEDVMPKIAASIDLLVFVLSIVLNILLIVTFKKKNLFSEHSNRLMFQLIIVDIISWPFILIPGCVVALLGRWDLSMPVCYIQAVVITWMYLATFGFLTTLVIERTLKITNRKLHEKTFEILPKVTLISFLVWGVDLAIAVIPTSGWSKIDYDFYHASCIVQNEHNIYYLILLFLFGLGSSIIVGCVCIPIILKFRKEKIKIENEQAAKEEKELRQKLRLEAIEEEKQKKENDQKKEMEANNEKKSEISEKSKPPSPFTKQGWTETNKTPLVNGGVKKSNRAKHRRRRARTPKRRDKKLFEDDEKDPDFHLAVTYFIMWIILLVLWLPYFVVSLYHSGSKDEDFWRGYYSISVILAVCSFCIKPIIYLSHNRHLQEKTKNTIPKNVLNKASAVRMSFSDVVDKLDKIVFKSPRTKPSIQATVKTHSLAMKWMKKTNVKGGNSKQLPSVQSNGTIAEAAENTDGLKTTEHPDAKSGLSNTPVSKDNQGIQPIGEPETSTNDSTVLDIEQKELWEGGEPVIVSDSPEHSTKM